MFGFLKKRKLNKAIDQSLDAFEALVNSDIADIWKLTDRNRFVMAMSAWVSKKCGYGDHMEQLSTPERTFFVAQTLEMEVNNGGFSQFFYNSSGAFAHELYDAFLTIGTKTTAEICKTAVEAFGRRIPTDKEERDAFLDSALNDQVNAVLSQCDQAFYGNPDDLEDLNYQFIQTHREQFH